MTTVPHEFNGEKLTEARELNERTMVSLAEEAGLSRQMLSAYESGRLVPRPDNLYRLALILGVKESYFMTPSSIKSNPTYFRSFAALTKRARESAVRRLDIFQSLAHSVCETGIVIEPDIPDYNLGDSPEQYTEKQIEKYADDLRRDWRLTSGPISSMSGLLEIHGILIACSMFGDRNLDAFSEWGQDGRPYIYLCMDKHSAARAAFTYAHELGHLLLHRQVPKKKFESRLYHKLYEHQADIFAGAFLLPAQSFAAELPKFSLDYFLSIKPRWRVSVAAMIKRCAQLGWITESEEKNLWINYSRRGWRNHEPYDEDSAALRVDEPKLLSEAIAVLNEEGILTTESLREDLKVPADRLAKMFNLDILRSPNAPPLRSDDPFQRSLPANVILSNSTRTGT
ncbi:MAG: XRE family transcriptional regulator [Bacteroidota bacterium]|nr:XRE family transcriptional regulator [Bacteroidota bacterium]MDP4234050.1 XRE family transcriptional regulator [Bacteroidota bacterium]MDP4242916.1 XRE family transcriptional regulator [Bacteroidota bacterium]MDP4289265.1 XRE family transcriptional regulator [Bacteroidota bacterium]